MASNQNIRNLGSDKTAYQYDGTMAGAILLMELRVGYIDRQYSSKEHTFTDKLVVVTPAGQVLAGPTDWIIKDDNCLTVMTHSEFISKYFDLFFK